MSGVSAGVRVQSAPHNSSSIGKHICYVRRAGEQKGQMDLTEIRKKMDRTFWLPTIKTETPLNPNGTGTGLLVPGWKWKTPARVSENVR